MKTIRLLLVVLTAGTLLAQDRLDSNQMRDSLFSALSGNPEAFKKILDASSKALSLNPDHPQAMVWHGVATFGGFFVEAQKGNMPTAMASLQKGTAEMDRAVSLAPDDIEVRILRAVMYSPASRQLPPPMAWRRRNTGLVELAVGRPVDAVPSTPRTKLASASGSEPVSLGGVVIHRPRTIVGEAIRSREHEQAEILVLLSAIAETRGV